MDKQFPPGCKPLERSLTTVGTTRTFAIFEGVFRGHRFLLRYYYATGKLHVRERDLKRALAGNGRNYEQDIQTLIKTKEWKNVVLCKNGWESKQGEL